MKQPRLILVFISIALAAAPGCGRGSPPATGVGTTEVPPDRLQRAVEKLRLKLPSHAKATGVIDDNPDVLIQLKLEMPASEVNAFLAGSPFARKTLSTELRHVSNTGQPDWWAPQDAQSFRSAMLEVVPKAEGASILINLDDPATAVVYLIWFKM
ncbi:MAG: hypothetical protein AB7Q17_17175 [Phycisphaerae bacterium]